MERREYLGLTIVSALGSIAGCSSSPTGSDTPSPVESGEVSQNSADNFIEVEQGDTIRIEVTEEEQSAGGGTLVTLSDPAGEQLLEEEVDDERTVTYEAEQSGEYRVIVFTGGTASYEIYVE